MLNPEFVSMLVSIKNLDATTASVPREIRVSLKGLTQYTPFGVRDNPRYFPDSLSMNMFCSGQGCPTFGGAQVPSIPPLQQKDVLVRVNNPGYRLWQIDRPQMKNIVKMDADRDYILRFIYAGGFYMCPTHANDRVGSRIRIKAAVDTHGDDQPGNNGMIRDVSFFGRWIDRYECTTTDTSELTPYRPRW